MDRALISVEINCNSEVPSTTQSDPVTWQAALDRRMFIIREKDEIVGTQTTVKAIDSNLAGQSTATGREFHIVSALLPLSPERAALTHCWQSYDAGG